MVTGTLSFLSVFFFTTIYKELNIKEYHSFPLKFWYTCMDLRFKTLLNNLIETVLK